MMPASPEDLTFVCQIARTDSERAAYFALRRTIFCDEQGLFGVHDRDEWDHAAYPIVCLARSSLAGDDQPARVVGVVRIWEESPGDWWGGRLGVDAQFRTAAVVGRRLVQHAVGTARAWGAWRFRATVQQANVAFFRRLRWHSLEERDVLGRPHALMQAALDRYVITTEIRRDLEAGAGAEAGASADVGADAVAEVDAGVKGSAHVGPRPSPVTISATAGRDAA